MQINTKWLAVFIISFVVFIMVGFLTYRALTGGEPLSLLSPWGGEVVREEQRIFDKYAFPALARREYHPGKIRLEEVLKKDENFTSWLFSYYSDGRKITGMANIPSAVDACFQEDSISGIRRVQNDKEGRQDDKCKGFPLVILIRGFVPDEVYRIGVGTQKAADFFAQSGFITLAPDFLGFGESDQPPAAGFLAPLADRFEKPVTILNLLASVKTLEQADPEKVFFWAHSNGGQIALSVLEITKKPIPTVLWAPVTKSFPYNVLYFSDEAEDKGKYLRKLISEFEKDYDADLYSIHKYFVDITASMQLHQGTADEAVPIEWSNEFYGEMKGLGKEIEYFKYEGDEHYLQGGWDQAAERSLEFYKSKVSKVSKAPEVSKD